ncbi:DUF1365 domain-containing protein [Pseudoalteromonas carrageenovora]|uniref:DUF1365 domain-containing protein n=1 Tax=Pseudoalteromonas carrageenovora TaxID=227 RepID=UPI0026E16A1E|nr:DUF1365 domain-containing protein [Pseudoalteromonas carrageenovora]MDO6546237.1 DUF1365 domain-containing protein [Pseudoalteromonas carrageenovora]MDO6833479.1 DUF1365 domain-containing protein [Pseudoalteromonas carrageenovora]
MTSAVYLGDVRHRRFAVKNHSFNYSLYMMWVDLKQPLNLNNIHPMLGTFGFKALRFKQADYLQNVPHPQQHTVFERAQMQLQSLGVNEEFEHTYMLGQLRCFGIYFSPVNFYFYGHTSDEFKYLVAEVSNTPWNERHYYLVPLGKKVNFKKVFSVSPFMDLNMDYHWNIRHTLSNTLIHIENKKDETLLFDASLRLKRQDLTKEAVSQLLKRFPAMTWSVFKGIYVQAFKLFVKRVPFLGHS